MRMIAHSVLKGHLIGARTVSVQEIVVRMLIAGPITSLASVTHARPHSVYLVTSCVVRDVTGQARVFAAWGYGEMGATAAPSKTVRITSNASAIPAHHHSVSPGMNYVVMPVIGQVPGSAVLVLGTRAEFVALIMTAPQAYATLTLINVAS